MINTIDWTTAGLAMLLLLAIIVVIAWIAQQKTEMKKPFVDFMDDEVPSFSSGPVLNQYPVKDIQWEAIKDETKAMLELEAERDELLLAIATAKKNKKRQSDLKLALAVIDAELESLGWREV